MNPFELAKVAKQAADQGLDRCVLKMPTPQFRGRYPERVRTPFGLCKWYPANTGAEIIIFPTLVQIEKWLKRASAQMEQVRK